MRLTIHNCDNTPKAEELRKKEGKKHIKCKNVQDQQAYFANNVFGLDVDTDSPTLGKSS